MSFLQYVLGVRSSYDGSCLLVPWEVIDEQKGDRKKYGKHATACTKDICYKEQYPFEPSFHGLTPYEIGELSRFENHL